MQKANNKVGTIPSGVNPVDFTEQEIANITYDSVNHSQKVSIVSGATGTSSDQVQGTAADNAAAVGNPIRNGSVYNSSVQTYSSGDVADQQADVNGNIKVTLATKLDPVNDGVTAFEGGWYLTPITTAATTVVANVPCYVKRIKTIGAGVAGNITAYDNTAASGTLLVPTVAQVVGSSVIEDAITCSIGLTVVTTGTSPVILVAWRPA